MLTMDANILFSRINMELRDDESLSLEDVCASHDWDVEQVLRTMAAAGFEYSEQYRKFW